MACFDVWLIGKSQPFKVELNLNGIDNVTDALGQMRYLEGDLITTDGELIRTIIPTARIQMICELHEYTC